MHGRAQIQVHRVWLQKPHTLRIYCVVQHLALEYLNIVAVDKVLIKCSSVNCCCSVAQLCLPICNPMDCSTPGFHVCHHLLELAQTHVHWISDSIQPSHPLSSPSPPTFNLSQHQGLFSKSTLHQVTKVLELQLQHQPFQWIFRTDFL